MNSRGLTLLLIALLICSISVLSIYSSNYQKEGSLWQQIYKRQMLWIALGLLLFLMASHFNYRRFWDITYILYASVVLLLILVFILGSVRLGAQRWLKFGWFTFQPTEVVKLVTAIFLARYFSMKSTLDLELPVSRFGIVRALILPFIFVGIPAALIVEQPDLGSGIIVLLLLGVMLFTSGIRKRYLMAAVVLALASLPFFWHFLRDYQKERLMVFLNPNIDPLGAGYTIIQSKIAIGSGGLLGKGWLLGTQSQLHFLPEAHTDFIFATFSEEWGFLGSVILLLLYYFLIRQGIRIAKNTNDYFGKLLAFGISLMFFVQVVVNIAMNLGLAPVVGVPLPLMSYGGSSLFVAFISLGILVNIDKQRAVF